jgi:hypothetical protein
MSRKKDRNLSGSRDFEEKCAGEWRDRSGQLDLCSQLRSRRNPTGSTSEKITAVCLFLALEFKDDKDKGNVSVQLIETTSTKMVWAYSVNKQRGGSKDEQSMAEAVAKHLKEFVEKKR